MKKEKHVEEAYYCDECGKEITKGFWYRIFLNDRDFCSFICAEVYRNAFYRIVEYERYPRVVGNTD